MEGLALAFTDLAQAVTTFVSHFVGQLQEKEKRDHEMIQSGIQRMTDNIGTLKTTMESMLIRIIDLEKQNLNNMKVVKCGNCDNWFGITQKEESTNFKCVNCALNGSK